MNFVKKHRLSANLSATDFKAIPLIILNIYRIIGGVGGYGKILMTPLSIYSFYNYVNLLKKGSFFLLLTNLLTKKPKDCF